VVENSIRRTEWTRKFLIAAAVVYCMMNIAFGQPKVYRDRVEPHWFGDQSHFWYRNELPQSESQFILVDAAAGTRKPAFDHAAVAAQMSEILKQKIEPSKLPIDSLKFADNRSTVVFSGLDGRFTLDMASAVLTREFTADESSPVSLFLPVRASGASDKDTEIVLQNKLDYPVLLFWVDPDGGKREYGRVSPGETRRQHTFAGHVWLFSKSDGTDIGCFEARSSSFKVMLDQAAVDSVKHETRRHRRGGRAPREIPQNPVTPDGAISFFVRDHNLWIKHTADSAEAALTSDGSADNTFRRDASRARGMSMQYDLPNFPDEIADVQFSPGATYALAFQTTQVPERLTYYVESTPSDQLQPKLKSYPYFKPGDAIPIARPRLFRLSDRTEIPISTDLFADPWQVEFLRWSDDGSRFWLLYNQRGHQRLRVLEVMLETGTVRAIVDEHSDTFIHYSSNGKFELRWLPENQLLWASERSGWNHLYRYDHGSGEVINAVTTGDWNVRRIENLDEQAGVIWFYAVGVQPEQDPYHEHYCRVNFDGTEMKILTDGDGTHDITWSPDRRWFLDRYSRVDLAPITELRMADGQLQCRLEEGDASEIIRERGALPQRFVAKGRDGETDIWGILHRPKDFDPAKSYPVVENIYAGPHDHHVPKQFSAAYGHQQRIADAGFLVVQIDGMGTAWRSRKFHDICFRNLRDAGFPDRILWMKALAEKTPQMDLTRVGIYGGSAGGQNAMAALLWHGDFYKAAVADCGCHDNRMDKIWWNEQWMGVPAGDHYEQNSNMVNAYRLQGRLMLVVGELDRNVDPATSTQVAKKLIDAGKDFDFVVVPGAGHGACETPWASQRRTAFFVRELQN